MKLATDAVTTEVLNTGIAVGVAHRLTTTTTTQKTMMTMMMMKKMMMMMRQDKGVTDRFISGCILFNTTIILVSHPCSNALFLLASSFF
jgi:hypothetical protein